MTGTLVTGFLWILLLEGLLRLYLPQGFETWRFVVYPLVLLLMMLLRPEGLMGRYEMPFLRQILPTWRPRDASGDGNQEGGQQTSDELRTSETGEVVA